MNDILLRNALRAHQTGNYAEAARLCQDILRAAPRNLMALHLLGYVQLQTGNFVEAERLLGEAFKIDPAPETIYNRGCALQNLRRDEEALRCFQRAIALKPDFLDALVNCGISQLALRRYADALESFDKVLSTIPADAEAWNNRGNALLELGRLAEALASFDKAIALKQDYVKAWNNRGVALQRLNRHPEALFALEHALAIDPRLPSAYNNRGNSSMALRHYEDAYADFERASALDSNFVEPIINRATVLVALRRVDEGIVLYNHALGLCPNSIEALRNRANAFVIQKRFEDAARDCEKILMLDPASKFIKGIAAHNRLQSCDWRGYHIIRGEIDCDLRAGATVIPPFEYMALSPSPADQHACARIFAADKYPPPAGKLWQGESYRHQRIRIAYLSADFRNHAVPSLAVGLFENHTRDRFETVALSFGKEKTGAMRARLEHAFERFIDVERRSEDEIAQLIREMEIDIAVDLMGYTGDCRPAILNLRPAPLQINYLGYPGTMGADHIDYIIADRVVIPENERDHYAEEVVYLPECYLPHDSRRALAGSAPSRALCGLPEGGFVFCSFNNTYKLSPDLFDVWMRLLHAVKESVLWLAQGNTAAMRNLTNEAAARGIPAGRIVFAPYLPSGDEHFARLGAADLFLDTLPFNGHTTSMDALWSGVPVLTCTGTSFAGRVAASVLAAAGLPELITESLEAYETRARALARDRSALSEIKSRVIRGRTTSPLFDIRAFTRNLEAAYVAMWERQQRGEAPSSFAVERAMAPASS
jgi:protein O-GlcNAc transferase